jgi:hypothetical protein
MLGGRSRVLAGLLLSFAWVPLGCGRPQSASSPGPVEEKKAAATAPSSVPRQRDADDVARFVAGLPGTPGSPYIALQDTPAWKEHRQQLDQAWHATDGKLVAGLQEFQKAELNDAALRNATVYYPFSGPDTLTPTLCSPQAATYVMVALEPAGTLPTFKQIEDRDLGKYLPALRETMESILGRSFFITRDMDREFRGQVTDGLFLPILHVLVRQHFTITGFRYVRIDDNGRIVDRPVNYKAATPYGNKGLEIEFRSDKDQTVHNLYYFSVNLDDGHLLVNKPFLAYSATLNSTFTLLKATSYMTHHPEFSMIRDLILAHSAAILQDDSGIPYRFFHPDIWKVQLYGDYQEPYGSFKWLVQLDLQKAYKEPGIRPLPLRIGYGYGKVASNLLLARRIAPLGGTTAAGGTK